MCINGEIFAAWCSNTVLQWSSASHFNWLFIVKRSIKWIHANLSLQSIPFQLTYTRTEPNESLKCARMRLPSFFLRERERENSVESFSRSFFPHCNLLYSLTKQISKLQNVDPNLIQMSYIWLVPLSFGHCPVKVFCLFQPLAWIISMSVWT